MDYHDIMKLVTKSIQEDTLRPAKELLLFPNHQLHPSIAQSAISQLDVTLKTEIMTKVLLRRP